jgi:hypothetical protein
VFERAKTFPASDRAVTVIIGPISKHISGLGKNKTMVMGPETKNDCADEGQQQITALSLDGMA